MKIIIQMGALVRRIKILQKSFRIRRYLSDAPSEPHAMVPNAVYIKNNYIRAPRFRINTIIVQEGEEKRVLKQAASPEAEQFLRKIAEGRNKLADVYNTVEVINCTKTDAGLEFPYIEGESLLSGVDPSADSIEDIQKSIEDAFAIIFDYKETPKPFAETEQFRINFPGIHPRSTELSYSVINLDSNLDNYVRKGDRVFCFDYEWVEDYPIPIRFVKFRAILRYYVLNKTELAPRIKCNDFISLFGYSKSDIRMFTAMEDWFQLYIEDLHTNGSSF